MRLKDLNVANNDLDSFILDKDNRIIGMKVYYKRKKFKIFKVKFNQTEIYFINLIADAWEATGKSQVRKKLRDVLGPQFYFKSI